MTFLPIVDRELRVASRQRGTYSMRLRIVLLAVLLGAPILFVNLGAPPATIGNFMFIGLSALALLYCLLSGRRSTVDCLSEEKREGTLGLLFLTDLKGYDVVLGKMAATSLNAFYGLLALFPVLAIPMLMGGVTNGQFWRMVLVLVNTFVFSLAVGIFSSALSRDARKAMALNFALLVFFTLVLPFGLEAIVFAMSAPRPIFALFISSPICTFITGLDANYRMLPQVFWSSLALIHGITWLLVVLACRIVPRSWQDKPPPPRQAVKGRWQAFWHFWNYGFPGKRHQFRKKLLDVNAFYWHAARARLKPYHVWAFLALVGCWWLWGRINSGAIWNDQSTHVVMALLVNATLKLWVALEAGQRLAEDKKIGALELLLSTPLMVRDIVRGQLLALRRQFLGPVIFVMLLELFLMESTVRNGPRYAPELRIFWLAGLVMLAADLAALSLVGMAQALSRKTHNQAILRTVTLILVLPWIGFGLASLIGMLWSEFIRGVQWAPDRMVPLAWWFGSGMLADVVFGWMAWWQLRNRMREYAMERFAPTRAGGWFHRRKAAPAPRSAAPAANPAAPKSWLRKNWFRGLIALILLLACAGFFLTRSKPNYPPALVVPVSLGQGPLRIFPYYRSALFILPDGSLWRWGQFGKDNRNATVPEPFQPGNDWIQAESWGVHWLGLRKDGTIWEQRANYSSAVGSSDPNPGQPDAGHDWVRITGRGTWCFAIKRDGTLWAWSAGGIIQNNIPIHTNLVQIGTNTDWADVRGNGMSALALRADGSLWVMGRIWLRGSNPYLPLIGGAYSPTNLPVPLQVCRETNWVSLMNDTLLARNRQGELWDFFYSPPGEDQGAVAVGRLFCTNAVPDHFAFAYCGDYKAFQIHEDGTLWERIQPYGADSGKPVGKLHQVGNRQDWSSLWSGGGTAYGLTADGTLWTWGTDPNLEPVADLAAEFRLLQDRLNGTTSPGTGLTTKRPQFQKAPRPLMKFDTASP